jgi:hypothetical protein
MFVLTPYVCTDTICLYRPSTRTFIVCKLRLSLPAHVCKFWLTNNISCIACIYHSTGARQQGHPLRSILSFLEEKYATNSGRCLERNAGIDRVVRKERAVVQSVLVGRSFRETCILSTGSKHLKVKALLFIL